MIGSDGMHTKAPLEYIWRPIAEAIDLWLDGPRMSLGDFFPAFLISGLIVLVLIAWVVTRG
jgi:hypothetical protein